MSSNNFALLMPDVSGDDTVAAEEYKRFFSARRTAEETIQMMVCHQQGNLFLRQNFPIGQMFGWPLDPHQVETDA